MVMNYDEIEMKLISKKNSMSICEMEENSMWNLWNFITNDSDENDGY